VPIGRCAPIDISALGALISGQVRLDGNLENNLRGGGRVTCGDGMVRRAAGGVRLRARTVAFLRPNFFLASLGCVCRSDTVTVIMTSTDLAAADIKSDPHVGAGGSGCGGASVAVSGGRRGASKAGATSTGSRLEAE
jgi:hypothetical protein